MTTSGFHSMQHRHAPPQPSRSVPLKGGENFEFWKSRQFGCPSNCYRCSNVVQVTICNIWNALPLSPSNNDSYWNEKSPNWLKNRHVTREQLTGQYSSAQLTKTRTAEARLKTRFCVKSYIRLRILSRMRPGRSSVGREVLSCEQKKPGGLKHLVFKTQDVSNTTKHTTSQDLLKHVVFKTLGL